MKVCKWNVYSRSGAFLGVIEACNKQDAEMLANIVFNNAIKPLTVEYAGDV